MAIINPQWITKEEGSVQTADEMNTLAAAIKNNAVELQTDINNLSTHESDHQNPHVVTKAQVGLSNADNTSDMNKPISTAMQSAISNLTLDSLSDVTLSSTVKDQVIKFNGAEWVAADVNTSFIFSISTFTCTAGTNNQIFEIGNGNWKSIGDISFSTVYINGPATNGYISTDGIPNLILTNNFQGPTTNTNVIVYPTVGGTRTFILSATDGIVNAEKSINYIFNNRRYYGIINKNSGITEVDIKLLDNELVNDNDKTFTVSPTVDDYIIYAYPTRLGLSTFTVGGFVGGFDLITTTLSITNNSGYTENYTVYCSTNKNLGTTNVVVN